MRVKGLVRRMGILFASLLLLPTVAAFILYVPPIQDAAVRWTSAWLTRCIGMEIKAEKLQLLFPLRIKLQGLHVGTLLSIGNAEASIKLRPLLQGVMRIDHVSAQNIDIHTDTLDTTRFNLQIERFRIDDIAYHWSERKANIQRIILTNGDVAWHGSTSSPKGTALDKFPLLLNIADVRLLHIDASYAHPSMLLQSFVNEVALHNIAIDTALHIALQRAEFRDGEGVLRSTQQTAETIQLMQLNAQADSLYYSPTDFSVRLTELTFKESNGIALQEGSMDVSWHNDVLSLPHFALQTEHSTLQGHLYTLNHNAQGVTIDGDVDLHIGHTDVRILAEWIGGIPQEFISFYPTETLSCSISLDGTTEQLLLTQCSIVLPTVFDININGMVQGITTLQQCVAQGRVEAHTYDLSLLTALISKTGICIPPDITYQGNIHYAPDMLHTQWALILREGTMAIEASYQPTKEAYELKIDADSLNLQQIIPEGEWGITTLQAHLVGHEMSYRLETTTTQATLQLHTLQWKGRNITNTSAQASLADGVLHAHATCNDSLMQWNVMTTIKRNPDVIRAQFHAQIDHLDLRALQLANTDICPILQCQATLSIVPEATYTLHARFTDIALSNATQRMQPHPLELQALLTADTAQLDIRSGDLSLTTSVHIDGLPWEQEFSSNQLKNKLPSYLSALQATLSVGPDNPMSNYLALTGITFRTLRATISEREDTITSYFLLDDITAKGISTDSISLNARYSDGLLYAHLQSTLLTWNTPQMQFRGHAEASLTWGGHFDTDSLRGLLHLYSLQYTLPAYSLHLQTSDKLHIPFEKGGFTLTSIPLYTTDHFIQNKRPLLLDGRIAFIDMQPIAQLRLTANNTQLLQAFPTREAIFYGKALVNCNITLDGPLNALSIAGNLHLRPGTSLHYTYKNAILTANNQLDNIVTFISFDDNNTALTKGKLTTNNLVMNLAIVIDPTARLEVSLGANKQNNVTLQGGGTLNLQHIPATGLRLSGDYTIETGELNMNVPLLHVSHMTIRQGSTITWSGNPQNPQLDITAEERIHTSVTLDGTPQSVLFVAGVSLTDTMNKLSVQLTLSSPENASLQNTLTTLSPEERGKLAVALLTTGLYLGEGGTGNLMNTALMSILQSQIDNISRDAFRTVDVSVGIEPLPNGVSDVSTRTDYSFSITKRLWDNRIRIIIGGSVTTNNERIEKDAIIDNISIEWRINPKGNQYLRFFYDKNYESILEGEIREAGMGYAYRRRF